MAICGTRSRVTAALTALAAAAGLALSISPAAAADPPISYERVVVPMIFPVLKGASYTDTFGACRGAGCSRKHLGQDLMSPKWRPLVAAFTGTISYVKRETRIGEGNYFSLTGTTGWTVNYIHANNDRPGTDDGKGTANWFLMPGLKVGSQVFAGQQVGWSGDSGNAENTSPHTHFELRKGAAWSGTVYNPYASLKAARILQAPYVSGPHPDGTLITASGYDAYVLRDGHRQRISWSNIEAHGYSAAQAIKVTSAEVRWYPSGGWAPIPDGLVVRGPEGDMWVIGEGQRVRVPNGTDLSDLGTTSARVVPSDAASIARMPLAADQTLPGVVRPGALLRDASTDEKWYIDGGTRRLVPDSGTMRGWGWSLAETTVVSARTLAEIPEGAPMKLRDGTVFRSPAGRWYVASQGQRRAVPSAIARKAYGWALWPSFVATLESTLRLPLGAPLP